MTDKTPGQEFLDASRTQREAEARAARAQKLADEHKQRHWQATVAAMNAMLTAYPDLSRHDVARSAVEHADILVSYWEKTR